MILRKTGHGHDDPWIATSSGGTGADQWLAGNSLPPISHLRCLQSEDFPLRRQTLDQCSPAAQASRWVVGRWSRRRALPESPPAGKVLSWCLSAPISQNG